MINLNQPNSLPANLNWYWLAKVILYFILPLVFVFIAVEIVKPYLALPAYVWQWAWWGLIIYLLLIALAYVLMLLRFAFTSFTVTDHEMTIASGIFNLQQKAARFDNVQDVDVTMDIFQRLFSLGVVEIWTASESQSQNGVPKPAISFIIMGGDAVWLKDYILNNRPGA